MMINIAVEDSISGWIIKGIWSRDENLLKIYNILIEK
jgi:hypothetical protein